MQPEHDQKAESSADVLERLLTQANTAPQDSLVVQQRAAAHFTWDYARRRPNLADLYQRSLDLQWRTEDLAWDTPVDQERLVTEEVRANPAAYRGADLDRTVFSRWGEKEWVTAGIELQNWTISQFLHGEQGALVCTAKLVETVPWLEAKFYAGAQVMDEARHVDVFSRYLDEKLTETYPVNTHLQAILMDIVHDDRWDMVYLGMQTLVEGLALAAFNLLRAQTNEPLLKQMLEKVITDEARHVAFGVVSLREFYRELTAAEIRERQEFALESVLHLRDRFMQQEAWARIGVPPRDVAELMARSPERDLFGKLLMSKIIPQCRAIGLIDAGDGWLRERLDELDLTDLEMLDDGTGGYEKAFESVGADGNAEAG